MKKIALILLCINASFCLYAMDPESPNFKKDDDLYNFDIDFPRGAANAIAHVLKKGDQKSKAFLLYPTKKEAKREEHCMVHRIIPSPSKTFLAVLISRKIDQDDIFETPVLKKETKYPVILQPLKVKIFKLPLKAGKAGDGNYPTPSKIIVLPTRVMPPAMINAHFHGNSPEIWEAYKGYRRARTNSYPSGKDRIDVCFADDNYRQLAVSDDGKKVFLGSCNQIMEFDTTVQTPLHKTVLEREEKKRKDDITFKKITLDEDNRLHVTYSDGSKTIHDI